MQRLTDVSYVKQIMEENGIRFQKKFGQNFLITPEVPARIADECGAKPEDGILEIGPGIGTLTECLCERYRKVVAIEIDDALVRILPDTLSRFDNVTVLHEDAMKTDLGALLAEQFDGMRVTVCANLPYYITTPILLKLLESRLPFDNITVMIQREVADRLAALPGTADYGAVTLAVAYYAEAEKLFRVSPGNFLPPPKVDSTVIRLKMRKEPICPVQNEAQMFRLIRAAFDQRRKTLLNALTSGCPSFSKEQISAAIEAVGMRPDIRGEKLSVADFARLSDQLC